MTGFDVQPKALDEYAKIVGSSASSSSVELDYLISYMTYVDEWVKVSGSGLIFTAMEPKIASVATALTSSASTLTTTLIESAWGLESAASTYRSTDKEQSRQLDSVYKPTGTVPPAPDGGHGGAVVMPATKLTEPSDENVVPDLVQEMVDAAGLMSESDLVIKILRWCGIDIFGWLSDRYLGDHKQLARCKSALEHLGEFEEAAAEALTEGLETMRSQWTGNASDAADIYFTQLAKAIKAHGESVTSVAGKIGALMAGIQEGVASIEGAISLLLDKAIEAAAAVAAAGCLEEVPGLDVLMDIIGAAKVLEVIKAVKEVADVWSKVWTAHEAIVGVIAGMAGGLQSYDTSSPTPTQGYYNGAQGPAPRYDDSDSEPSRKGGPR